MKTNMGQNTNENSYGKKHDLPHWSEWLALVLLLIILSGLLTLLNKPVEMPPENTWKELENSIHEEKFRSRARTKVLQKEEVKLIEKVEGYETRIKRENVQIEILEARLANENKAIDSLTFFELYLFFTRVDTAAH